MVTLNTFWAGVRGSVCNITLDFNGLRSGLPSDAERVLKIEQRLTH